MALAYPNALGAGATTRGAATNPLSASVVQVTNLNDSGAGSLRDALESVPIKQKSDRFIVFTVSGTIELTSNIRVAQDNITILGQTAPVGGITITGNVSGDTFIEIGETTNSYSNIIVRYIRVRPDYRNPEADALSARNVSGIIYDHCSFSWGSDEISSTSFASDNVTYQNCIFGEGKTGQIMGNSQDPTLAGDSLSSIQNFYYNVSHRHPNMNTDGRADVINNVVYNWNFRMTRILGGMQLNHINNYYLRQKDGDYALTNMMKLDGNSDPGNMEVYTAGNIVLPGVLTDPATDNWFIWTSFGTWSFNGEDYVLNTPRAMPALDFQVGSQFTILGPTFNILTAAQAYAQIGNWGADGVLDENGNKVGGHDAVDTRYITNASGNIADPYVYSSDPAVMQADIAAKQHYIDFQASVSSTPINTHPGSFDTNNDGIPDAWTSANMGGASWNDVAPSGYLWIEEFANSIQTSSSPILGTEDVANMLYVLV